MGSGFLASTLESAASSAATPPTFAAPALQAKPATAVSFMPGRMLPLPVASGLPTTIQPSASHSLFGRPNPPGPYPMSGGSPAGQKRKADEGYRASVTVCTDL